MAGTISKNNKDHNPLRRALEFNIRLYISAESYGIFSLVGGRLQTLPIRPFYGLCPMLFTVLPAS